MLVTTNVILLNLCISFEDVLRQLVNETGKYR